MTLIISISVVMALIIWATSGEPEKKPRPIKPRIRIRNGRVVPGSIVVCDGSHREWSEFMRYVDRLEYKHFLDRQRRL